MNKITEKFFTQSDFSTELKRALDFVIKKTGFRPKQEIWRGLIYEKNKVGSVIFDGLYNNQPAILKLQGLKPELDEASLYKLFARHNKSKKIRLPRLLGSQKWNKKLGFGYQIQEKLTGTTIFNMPQATKSQMKLWAEFYNEYRTKTVSNPFWKAKNEPKIFFALRLNNWIKICKHKKMWEEIEIGQRVKSFKKIITTNTDKMPFLFSHGHLTANDIIIQDNKFVLLSNLFWSWRPKYYDLAFNLWACLLKLPSNTSFKKAVQLVDAWQATYKTIPWVKKQNDFDKLFHLMISERLIGSIVVDLGIKRKQSTHNTKFWKLHLKLFDYYQKKYV